MQDEIIDELVERYIGALIAKNTWQTVAAKTSKGGIPGPTLDIAEQQHRQALEPLWNEYKRLRQLGNAPQQAVQALLVKTRILK
jgi:hypothetical protein